MTTFESLYQELLQRSFHPEEKRPLQEYDPHHLDCLLNPQKYPPVLRTAVCTGEECDRACQNSCIFDAIVTGADGKMTIDPAKCVGCSACIEACDMGILTASKDILPAMKAVRESGRPAYVLVAPAFLGQFSEEVTPGKLRSAFNALGFAGMLEVALFADILTLKEALEFDRNILHDGDYQLTSCCCPMWIAMIRKIYHELMPHVPGAVSPMIACGRVVKKIHPDAITVFVGPCIAKKSEAREPDLAGAVDFVLTFEEVRDIFEAASIDPAKLPENERDHSSRAGRIYARTGGVSEAVRSTVEQLNPHREITVKTRQADGVPACRAMIEELKSGKAAANFYEGMGCVGGCVGGPKAIINREFGREQVNAYGDDAVYSTPLENPYVIELLHRLGFDTVEELLEYSDIFTRKF
ncbi:MAG: [Fe-Fe] hydrogenase large subunit C-terminal domain-containing protein [Oscillospiraceae bacterium]